MKIESQQTFRCWSETCHGQLTSHDIFTIENNEHYTAPNGEKFDVKAVCQHCGRVMGTWLSLLM